MFLQSRGTPRDALPPRPPVKSAPPVSRIFPHRPVTRAQIVSFRSEERSECILKSCFNMTKHFNPIALRMVSVFMLPTSNMGGGGEGI